MIMRDVQHATSCPVYSVGNKTANVECTCLIQQAVAEIARLTLDLKRARADLSMYEHGSEQEIARLTTERDALRADLTAVAEAVDALRVDFGGWWLSSPSSEPLGRLREAFHRPGVQAVLTTHTD